MAPPHDIAGMQPLQSFFDIRCNGISNIFINPDIPVQFEIQTGLQPYMSVTLLDITGKNVEPALYQSAQTDATGYFDIEVQWGYTAQQQLTSPIYQMKAKQYNLIVGKNLHYIVLHGEGLLMPMVSSNPYSGTAVECIKKFCQNHNYALVFNPQPDANQMQDVGLCDFDSTEPVERKHNKLANEVDLAFFYHLVSLLADSNGVVGYQAYFYTDTNGNTTCEISNNSASGVAYTFDYPAPDGAVIDWRPKCEMLVVEGSNGAQTNGNCPISGDSSKFVYQQQLTQPFSGNKTPPVYDPKANPPPPPASKWQQFNSSNAMEAAVKANSVRSWHGGTISPWGQANSHLSQHIKYFNKSFEAELEILGDPTIQPGQRLQMNYYLPNSRELHNTSGVYVINNARHSIINGEQRTVLEVWKCDTTVPTQDSGTGADNVS